ncbi:hypothetical protein F4821DRAFT_42460 [Hypoxylon rubiginosum]|uniref:Uncharacterized protein n=1 Tax=Hypoxylon rubiginosum TaxID=110542 RepID=A0ACC0CKM0_9PEZI|nr:hypothetical protein F4821DRAFT_42460 [Hypoxylon rubiginosum]
MFPLRVSKMHFSILLSIVSLCGSALSTAFPKAGPGSDVSVERRDAMTTASTMADGAVLHSTHPYGNTITINGINEAYGTPVQAFLNVMRDIDDLATKASRDTAAPFRGGAIHSGAIQFHWRSDANNSPWWPNFVDWQTLLNNAYRLAERKQACTLKFDGQVRDSAGQTFNVEFYLYTGE